MSKKIFYLPIENFFHNSSELFLKKTIENAQTIILYSKKNMYIPLHLISSFNFFLNSIDTSYWYISELR